MKPRLPLAILLATAVLAMVLVVRSGQQGMGFSPDSVSYFTMAEGLAAGKGFVDVRRYDSPALPIYPPGYSLLIAAAGLVAGGDSADLMAALPYLNGLLFAVAALIVLRGLVLATGSFTWTAAGALLYLGSGDSVKLYSKVWSETAFLVATLLFMLLLARHLDLRSKDESPAVRWLIGAALAAGFAAIVRYPGVAAIGGGGLLLLLWRQPLRRRLIDATIFGAVSALPLALWLLRNLLVFGRPYLSKDRAASAHAFSTRNLELGLETLTSWTGSPTGIYLLCLGGLIVGLALRPRDHQEPKLHPTTLLAAVGAFALPYAAVMVVGTYGYGLHKPLDMRALAPIFGPLIWLTLLAGRQVVQTIHRRLRAGAAPRVGAVMALASVVALAVFTGRHAWSASDPAKNYGMLQKKKRAVVEAFRDIEPTGKVFTNIDDHLYLLTGKPCLRLPQVYSLDGRDQPLPDFDEKMAELKSQLGDAGMIVYYSPSRRLYLPSEEELQARLSLEVVRTTEDGTIYRVSSENR